MSSHTSYTDDTTQPFEDVLVTKAKPLPVILPRSDSDAFGRLRISEATLLFSSQLQYDEMDLAWSERLTTGGTFVHDANGSFGTLTTTTTSGSEVIRQSPHQRYQSGKSQLVLMTFDFVEQVAGQRKRVGYFDGANGAFLEEHNGTVSIVMRSSVSGSVVETRVNQSDWSDDAMLSKSGPSGIVLDITKSLIWCADFEWLGVGTVRVGFVIGGVFVQAHTFDNSNIINKTYMGTANLPARYEITNTATTASAGTLRQICTSVVSEGGFREDFGFQFSAGSGITTRSISARTAICSIRPKTTFNSIVNRALILPEKFEAFVSTNDAFIELVYNATLGGTPVWNSANANSLVEFDVAATTVTGGIVIDATYASSGGTGGNSFSTAAATDIGARYPINLDIGGANPKILSVVVTPFSNPAVVSGAIQWKEIR